MEFRKITKQLLTEDAVEAQVDKEKSDSGIIDTYEAREEAKTASMEYREAILEAAQSESNAIEEYEGILKMEEQTDKEIVDLFHDMITHIRDEEKAHFQMLTEGLSKFPGFDVEKELEKVKDDKKESVKESVNLTEEVAPNRTYNVWDIDKAAQKYIDFTDESYALIDNLFYRADDEIDAQEAQSIINTIKDTLHLTNTTVTAIENELNNTLSPAEKRVEEFREDIDSDINTLNNLIENNELQTYAANERLRSLIGQLNELKTAYHGEKDTGWRKENWIGAEKPTKNIIS